jgi:DNA polymerase-3 subunit delta
VRNSLLNREVNEETLSAAYFFYGEETYLAEQFTRQLKVSLVPPEGEHFNYERFILGDSSWMDIVDLARTIPFFFSPWRVIRVEVGDGEKGGLSAIESKLLKDYFSSPSPRTVIIIVLPEKTKKSHSLVRFFSSFPESIVTVREIKLLRGNNLSAWIDARLYSSGKRISQEGRDELVNLVGNDLQRLDNELEKLTLYVGEKKLIEVDDVSQVSAWDKSYLDWELTDNLERGDPAGALRVLNNLFEEGTKPENILGNVFRMFRDIYIAKLSLKEKVKDKKQIFRELKPQISENYADLYSRKFNDFFSLIERTSGEDLKWAFQALQTIDLSMKTSDVSVKTLLEEFVLEYCRRRKAKGPILKGPD